MGRECAASVRNRALIKILNSRGDVMLPCATLVSNVTVALFASIEATRTVARCFSRVASIFPAPTLAQSRISHPRLFLKVHWGTVSGPGTLPGCKQYSKYFAIS